MALRLQVTHSCLQCLTGRHTPTPDSFLPGNMQDPSSMVDAVLLWASLSICVIYYAAVAVNVAGPESQEFTLFSLLPRTRPHTSRDVFCYVGRCLIDIYTPHRHSPGSVHELLLEGLQRLSSTESTQGASVLPVTRPYDSTYVCVCNMTACV